MPIKVVESVVSEIKAKTDRSNKRREVIYPENKDGEHK